MRQAKDLPSTLSTMGIPTYGKKDSFIYFLFHRTRPHWYDL